MTHNNKFSNLTNASDKRLIALCRQHPSALEAIFSVLFKRYQQPVYNACLRFLRHEADAWDVCQEVFIRAFRHLHQFEGRSSFRLWLFRIVHNQCCNLALQRKRRDIFQDSGLLEELPAAEQEPVIPAFVEEQIDEALTQLSDTDREVLRLRFYQDQSLDEIAAFFGTHLSTAKMRLYRARDRFASAYEAVSLSR